MITHTRMSNFFPPMRRGESRYFEMTYLGATSPFFKLFFHFFNCESLVTRKMPLPCADPVGFAIQVPPDFLMVLAVVVVVVAVVAVVVVGVMVVVDRRVVVVVVVGEAVMIMMYTHTRARARTHTHTEILP
jgi:hypothetical protein